MTRHVTRRVRSASPGRFALPTRRAVAALVLFCVGASALAAAPLSSMSPSEFTAAAGKRENALRRFEIIAFGSYPIALFYTTLAFDLGAYIDSGYDVRYAPWPFKSEYSARLSEGEVLLRLGSAACLSLAVAGIDALIRSGVERREASARRSLFSAAPPERGLPAGGAPLPVTPMTAIPATAMPSTTAPFAPKLDSANPAD